MFMLCFQEHDESNIKYKFSVIHYGIQNTIM